MKITMDEFDIVLRIVEDTNSGSVILHDDMIVFNDEIEIVKCAGSHWCINDVGVKNVKIFPNLYGAIESAIIRSFMGKLSIALDKQREIKLNLLDLED